MMRDTTCRSALIAICLPLVCAALGSAQSRKRGQQEPRGLTGIPSTASQPLLPSVESRSSLAMRRINTRPL